MSTIDIVHHQRDEIIGSLTVFWDEKHIKDLATGEDKFVFTTHASELDAAKIQERTRILIPAEDGGFNEFIVFDFASRMNNMKYVTCISTATEMDKLYHVAPGTYTGNALELLQEVTEGTPIDFEIGFVEYVGTENIVIDKYIGAYSYIKRIASHLEAEVDFRIEVQDSLYVGRYIDLKLTIGEDNGKEFVVGKDLVDVEITVNSELLVTALRTVGPARPDGTFLETIVTDEDAYQRWNYKGHHIIDIHYVDSEDEDMTLAQLQGYGRKALNKRLAAAFKYRVDTVSLEDVYPHEKARLGDSVGIINPRMNPPFYAKARIIRVERPIHPKARKVYEIGEVVQYKQEDVLRTVKLMEQVLAAKLQAMIALKSANYVQPEEPTGGTYKQGDIWVNTAEGHKVYAFEEATETFEPKPFDYQALNVNELSAISADLGIVNAGVLNGVQIFGGMISSGSTINVETDVNVGQNIYLGNGLTAAIDRYIRFGDTANFAGVNNSLDIRGSARIFYTNPDGETWIDQSTFHEEPLSATVETGFCGFGAPKGNVATVGYTGVNFKQKKNYIPSSVTLTKVDGNAESVAINNLTEVGFILIVISASAAAGSNVDWRGYYSA